MALANKSYSFFGPQKGNFWELFDVFVIRSLKCVSQMGLSITLTIYMAIQFNSRFQFLNHSNFHIGTTPGPDTNRIMQGEGPFITVNTKLHDSPQIRVFFCDVFFKQSFRFDVNSLSLREKSIFFDVFNVLEWLIMDSFMLLHIT